MSISLFVSVSNNPNTKKLDFEYFVKKFDCMGEDKQQPTDISPSRMNGPGGRFIENQFGAQIYGEELYSNSIFIFLNNILSVNYFGVSSQIVIVSKCLFTLVTSCLCSLVSRNNQIIDLFSFTVCCTAMHCVHVMF